MRTTLRFSAATATVVTRLAITLIVSQCTLHYKGHKFSQNLSGQGINFAISRQRNSLETSLGRKYPQPIFFRVRDKRRVFRHSLGAALGEKTVDRPVGVVVVANDLTGRVDSPSVSEYRAREVEKREVILSLEKPMDGPAGIGVGACNLTTSIDVFRLGRGRAGNRYIKTAALL